MGLRQIKKVPERALLGGICAGFAYWFGWPVWVIRLLWTLAVLIFGHGAILYILFWIFLPKWDKTPEDFDQVTGG